MSDQDYEKLCNELIMSERAKRELEEVIGTMKLRVLAEYKVRGAFPSVSGAVLQHQKAYDGVVADLERIREMFKEKGLAFPVKPSRHDECVKVTLQKGAV